MPRIHRPVCYVTCPSWPARSPSEGSDTAQSLAPLADAFGWQVKVSPLVERAWAGHGAWTPAAARLADLRVALRHDVVWALRGGYGCMQLLPDVLKLRAARKPAFAGFSDNTVMHALWWENGWEEAFYSRTPPRSPQSRHMSALLPLMRGKGLHLDQAGDPSVRALNDGTCEGKLFVACLSVLAGLCGGPLMPDLRGAILCLEDIDEKPYNVDFSLRQLSLAGALRGVRGLASGFFTYTEKHDYSGPHIDTVLGDWARKLGVPCVDRLPFGHIDDHLPLPTGRDARFVVRRGRWSLDLLARPRPPWIAA
ncbi:MAG: LD-carboxypeptidase [Planctomycetota bacterium]